MIGLVLAARQSISRWQDETVRLQSEVNSLQAEAALEPDPARHTRLVGEATRRSAMVPSLGNLGWQSLVFSAIAYSLGLLPPCWILYRSVAALGVVRIGGIPCSLARATAAQLLGHAGKYIPGKALVVVLRVGGISPGTGSTALATTAVFYETLLMMGVGGFIAGGLLWSSNLPLWVRGVAALMAIGAIVPVCPPVMRRLIRLLRKENSSAALSRLSWPLFVESAFASLLSWALIGVSFTLLIDAIPSFESANIDSTVTLYPVASAAIALGMVLGFVSLLPGGAGVREYVTLLVLTPMIGPTHALLAVIAARLMFIAVEAILAGIAWAALRAR